jgi:oxygen-independent coproporphyrinogen-3 oxidase
MRDVPPASAGPAGLYIHFPFCTVRCTYCDFPTVAGRDSEIATYLDALEREIERGQPDLPASVDTVYLGGGTPSRMSADQVRRVMQAVRRRFDLADGAEVTLEGNPESLTLERLTGYLEAGITRVSVGIQSLDDRVLREAGRAHDGVEGLAAVARARESGFSEINADLIAGLPGEKIGSWTETVSDVAAAEPTHLSLYLLENDKETPLSRAVRSGRTRLADDEGLSEAYRRSVEVLADHGLEQYEISNFARPGSRSRHNLKYWSDQPYGGFGLGAHAYVDGRRRANRRDLSDYLRLVAAGEDAVELEDPWDPRRRLAEALILGLRRVEGVDLARLGERYGADVGDLFESAWDRARAAGLIESQGSRVALTPSGRLCSNELFAELI